MQQPSRVLPTAGDCRATRGHKYKRRYIFSFLQWAAVTCQNGSRDTSPGLSKSGYRSVYLSGFLCSWWSMLLQVVLPSQPFATWDPLKLKVAGRTCQVAPSSRRGCQALEQHKELAQRTVGLMDPSLHPEGLWRFCVPIVKNNYWGNKSRSRLQTDCKLRSSRWYAELSETGCSVPTEIALYIRCKGLVKQAPPASWGVFRKGYKPLLSDASQSVSKWWLTWKNGAEDRQSCQWLMLESCVANGGHHGWCSYPATSCGRGLAG